MASNFNRDLEPWSLKVLGVKYSLEKHPESYRHLFAQFVQFVTLLKLCHELHE